MPAFIALGLAQFACLTAEGTSVLVVPLFAAGPLGADAMGIGVAVGAFAIATLLLRPCAGRMTDARSRRPLLVGGGLEMTA